MYKEIVFRFEFNRASNTQNIYRFSLAFVRVLVYNKIQKGVDCGMEYMSCPEAAKKWGVSDRRVQKLCGENRIPGVSRIGNMWLIPKNTEKPSDRRTKDARKKMKQG